MVKAYNEVKSGISISAAAKIYNIPYSTLSYKVHGKTLFKRRMGPESYLSTEQENVLVLWILEMAKAGFSVTVHQLQDSVCKLVAKLNIETPFKNNRPGRHWYESFKKRHPEISLRTSQNLTESRAAVTNEALSNWFSEISEFFKEKSLESGNKVLAVRGNKTVYQKVNADEKEYLTVLLTGNAAGDLPPPMIESHGSLLVEVQMISIATIGESVHALCRRIAHDEAALFVLLLEEGLCTLPRHFANVPPVYTELCENNFGDKKHLVRSNCLSNRLLQYTLRKIVDIGERLVGNRAIIAHISHEGVPGGAPPPPGIVTAAVTAKTKTNFTI
ncbi:hypothetical protein HW555_008660 [Spodoptera exigua]|uniref:HTH CENPB-type domain-containing protein n=1 Tax=Spodoptera exigua TaxID=7107 RepID=A0A835L486_SPOEX|nr:hypothetical protein HW555_008660 [Spodoptera exigua]